MIDPGLLAFIEVIAGASASFIGLLFVAINLAIDNGQGSAERAIKQRLLAESAYAALLNIFFVAIVALVPDTNVGYILAAMGGLSLVDTLRLAKTAPKMYGLTSITVPLVVYIIEFIYGLYTIFHNHYGLINDYGFMALILFLFSVGLARAWALIGIRASGR